jgi:hypothetical protein
LYEYNAVIRSVHDGDSLRVDTDLGFGVWISDMALRLNGIDAPELGKPGGTEARDFLRSLLPVGATVTIRTHKDQTEKYGRMLAEVWTDPILPSINADMVTTGHAVPVSEDHQRACVVHSKPGRGAARAAVRRPLRPPGRHAAPGGGRGGDPVRRPQHGDPHRLRWWVAGIHPAPARLDVLVHRDTRRGTGKSETEDDELAAGKTLPVLDVLHSWARVVREERGFTSQAAVTISGERDVLTRALDWIAEQPWVDEMYTRCGSSWASSRRRMGIVRISRTAVAPAS